MTSTGSTARVRRVVLATGNVGKLRELQSLFGELCALVPQTELGISSIAETGATFEANALLKARHAARVSGLPAIADDSGLEVDALAGAPGVNSARYAGENATDETNNALLLDSLSAVSDPERTARFRSVIVFVGAPDDPAPLIAEGVWEGLVLREPRGEAGFGYDPLFLDARAGQTGGELPADEKNRRSHRGQAAQKMLQLLRERLDGTGFEPGYAQA